MFRDDQWAAGLLDFEFPAVGGDSIPQIRRQHDGRRQRSKIRPGIGLKPPGDAVLAAFFQKPGRDDDVLIRPLPHAPERLAVNPDVVGLVFLPMLAFYRRASLKDELVTLPVRGQIEVPRQPEPLVGFEGYIPAVA